MRRSLTGQDIQLPEGKAAVLYSRRLWPREKDPELLLRKHDGYLVLAALKRATRDMWCEGCETTVEVTRPGGDWRKTSHCLDCGTLLEEL
jgi:hypothetical protein